MVVETEGIERSFPVVAFNVMVQKGCRVDMLELLFVGWELEGIEID